MNLLDLSKMKKVATDDKTSTFEHEKGHKMVIMHTALPKILQEQIKRLPLANGGEVKGVHADLGEEKELLRGRSAAGTVTRLSKEPSMHQEPAKKRAKEMHSQKLEEIRSMKNQDRKYLDEGTPDGTVEDSGDNSVSDTPTPEAASHIAPITINVGQAAPAAAAAAPPPPPATPAAPPVEAARAPAATAPQQDPATPLEQQAQTTLGAAGMQQKGVREQQEVDAQKAQAQVPIEQAQMANAQEIQARQNQTISDMKQHTDQFAQYMNKNPINPRAYGESQTDSQKTQTAIGLFLGGLGGGGTSNMALDFLNKQIDRDVDAQKTNQHNQATIYGAYQHLYDDENVSTNLAKVSMNDYLIHKTNLAAAQLGTAQAKASADALAGKLNLENTQLRTDAAAILNNRQGGGSASKPSGAPEAANSSGLPTYHVLAPNAVQRSLGLNKVGVYDQDKLKSQLTKASQAESVLNGPNGDGKGGVHDLIQQMYESSGKGGFMSGLEQRMKSGLGHIPYVGSSFEGATNVITQGEGYKDYTRNLQTLKSDLGAALSGIINPSDLDKIVEANAPTLGDTPEDVEEKIQAVVNTIKKAVPHDELEKAGLWAKGKR